MRKSALTTFSMSGRLIFTATTSPLCKTALCTWAIEALPMGLGSMLLNTFWKGWPKLDATSA